MKIFKQFDSSFLAILFCVFAILGMTCTQGFAALSDDLVLYMSFDAGDATDDSGNGNDGTVSGASWTTDSDAPAGGAYSFDGDGDYIVVPDSPSLDIVGSNVTIMALVKPASFNDGKENCPIISKWDDDALSTDKSWHLTVDGANSGYNGTVFSYWSWDGEAHRSIRTDEKLKINKWKHVAIVIQEGSADVYFDGTISKSSSIGSYGLFYEGSRPVYIGAAEGESGLIYFDGLIDEVKIYKRALTSSEVKDMAEEAGITVTTTETTSSSTTTTTVPLYWGAGDGKTYNDFNGDAAADLCIFDENYGTWYIYSFNTNSGGVLAWGEQWGWTGAKPVPGDYDGDGAWDLGVFDEDSGLWYIMSLSQGVLVWGFQWGFPGATVVTGDYNGDGKHDMAVYDPSSGSWYILSPDGSVISWGFAWGWYETEPVSGDYNGDGIDDPAVYNVTDGAWYIHPLSGTNSIVLGGVWGWEGAEPVPGDYNGDLTNDLAVFYPYNGSWYIYSLSGHTILDGFAWGWDGAYTVPGDYDGDGWDDMAVYAGDTGYWYIMSMTGYAVAWEFAWGWPESKPVAVNADGYMGAYGNTYIAGDWAYAVTSNGSGSGTMSFSQVGSGLSGSLTTAEGETGTISGSIEGDDFFITVVYSNGDIIYLSATVSGSSLTGAWITASDGTVGTWSASK